MSRTESSPPHADAQLTRIVAATDDVIRALPAGDRGGFVSSDLVAVHTALTRVRERDLARGPVFCEWGSGVGGVCAVAASLGFEVTGLELQPELVELSRELLESLDLPATLVQGSYVPGDDRALFDDCEQTHTPAADSWAETGLDIAECDVVFVYPWPGEETTHDALFGRHATPGALLVTYHDLDRVLVQRHTGDPDELLSLGWLGAP